MDAKETDSRVARLAKAIWGQYGADIMKEWEERGRGEDRRE